MSVTLAVVLQGSTSGLLGADYEYAPYIKYWTSWGTVHRAVSTTDKLTLAEQPPVSSAHSENGVVTLGPFEAPTAPLNGDEAVWIQVMASSRYSGIASIDAVNKKREVYDMQAGTNRITYSDLLQAAVDGRSLKIDLTEPLLYMTLLRAAATADGSKTTPDQIEQTAAAKSYKGTLLATARLANKTQPAQATALSVALKEQERRPRSEKAVNAFAYGSPEMLEAMQQAQNMIFTAYGQDFYGVEDKYGRIVKGPTYPLGAEKTLEHMHLPVFPNNQGILPVVGLVQHTLESRAAIEETGPRPAEVKAYQPTRDSALHVEGLMASSAIRHGTTPQQVYTSIRTQHRQSHTDARLNADYLLARKVMAKTFTHTANAVRYQKDMRYPNKNTVLMPQQSAGAAEPKPQVSKQWIATQSPLRVAAAAAKCLNDNRLSQTQRNWRLLAATTRFSDEKNKVPDAESAQQQPDMEIECLMPVAIYNIACTDDCDGSGGTAVFFADYVSKLAEVVSEAEAPMLHAAKELASLHVACDVPASVSAAFVDTNGKRMTRDEQRKLTDLPMIGDAMDQRRESGGHLPGMWIGRASIAKMLEATGVNLKEELPALARDYAAWEHHLPMLMLEGTASTETTVLAEGEIARAVLGSSNDAYTMEQQATQRKTFLKSLLPTDAKSVKNALVEHMNLEGLNSYTTPQDEGRRSSEFLLGAAMIVSPTLAAMNPLYGQLHFVSPSAKTWGAEFGALLRVPLRADAATKTPAVGLVSTLGGRMTRAQFNDHIQPVMAVIQNQMPVASMFRMTDLTDAAMAQLRVGHVLTPDVLLACPKLASLSALETALDRHALGQRRSIQSRIPRTMPMAHAPVLLLGSAPAVKMSQGVQKNAAMAGSGTTLCFYMAPWALQEPNAAERVIKELDGMQQNNRIAGYTIIRDRPLKAGNDVITFVVSLPAV